LRTKKLPKKGKAAIAVTAVCLVAIIVFFTVYMTAFIRTSGQQVMYDPTDFSKQLSESEVRDDIEELIKNTEDIYVGFWDATPEGYTAARDKLIASAKAMSAEEFALCVMEYFAFFKDTHTKIAYTGSHTLDFYNISLHFDGNRYVSLGTSLIPKGAVLVAINQVELSDVIAIAAPLLPQENENTNKNTNYLAPIFLRAAGAELDGINSLEYLHQSEKKTIHIPMITAAEYDAFYGRSKKNIECLLINSDTLYIDYNAAYDGGDLSPALDYISDALHNKGIRNVIIDARGNGGGNDSVGSELLDALGLKYSSADFIVRYSPEATRQNGFLRSFGSQQVKGKINYGNEFGIQLKVFCDENTMSAATTLVSQVRYSGLGEIIGRSSGQSPNYKGNPVFLQLKNSGLVYSLATTQSVWDSVYQWKIGSSIEPDILVPYTANPMDYVKFD